MAISIEQRRGHSNYLYRSVSFGGRTRRLYVGNLSDPVTKIVAQANTLQGAYATAARVEVQQELEGYAKVEPLLRLLATRVNRCVQRHREKVAGQSRRHQDIHNNKDAHMFARSDKNAEAINLSREEFDALVENATDGDEEAVAELRQALRANPASFHLLGDIARHTQACLVELITKDAVVAREAMNLKVAQWRSDLLREGDSPLERLLVDQVLTTWIDMNMQQIASAQPHDTETIAKRWQQRLDAAQKRHLAALKALHDVRAFN